MTNRDDPPSYEVYDVYTNKKGVENKAYADDGDIPQKVVDKDIQDKESEFDPWEMPELKDTETPWNELTPQKKIRRVLWIICRILLFVGFLYFFICSLDFLSSAFKLLGGRATGEVFRNNKLLANPVCGVMIGVLATVLVQSSSTSTSIVVSMVGAGLLDVKAAIPIVMGANIGTSVTNTIVSLGQVTDKNDFRRAFAGATVHDMFNWLSVIILLPIESIFGYLYHISGKIVKPITSGRRDTEIDLLKVVTSPFTKMIIEVDKKGIAKIAKGEGHKVDTLQKICCGDKEEIKAIVNSTYSSTVNNTHISTESYCRQKCDYLFYDTGLSDAALGAIILVLALLLLCICLFAIVKTLNSLLKGNIRKGIKKFVNADFPGKAKYFTGYLAIIIGMAFTIVVQSSSIFTSTLTPLVGVGVVGLDRMYPLTLGSNIGTTTTGILAALANENPEDLQHSLQIALCHFMFNITGILLFYPIPFMRWPIPLAKFLGNQTAKYRWYAVVYLIVMFFLFPLLVFGLSVAGWYVLLAVGTPIVLFLLTIAIIKVIQAKCPTCLPARLRNWKWLPLHLRSLEPYHRFLIMCPCCKRCRNEQNENNNKYTDDIESNFTKL